MELIVNIFLCHNLCVLVKEIDITNCSLICVMQNIIEICFITQDKWFQINYISPKQSSGNLKFNDQDIDLCHIMPYWNILNIQTFLIRQSIILVKTGEKTATKSLESTFRYIDDVLSLIFPNLETL